MIYELSLATNHSSINIIFSIRGLTVMKYCDVHSDTIILIRRQTKLNFPRGDRCEDVRCECVIGSRTKEPASDLDLELERACALSGRPPVIARDVRTPN